MLYSEMSLHNISHYGVLYGYWGHISVCQSLIYSMFFSYVLLDADSWIIIVYVYISLCLTSEK